MAILLGAYPSLAIWRSRAAWDLLRRCPSRARLSFDDAGLGTDVVRELAGIEALAGEPRPLQAVISRTARRVRLRTFATRYFDMPLPSGSCVLAAPGVYVCMPELCFLLATARMPFLDLVHLGFELCGTYRRAPGVAGGLVSDTAPLTSAARLAAALDGFPGAYGAKAARRAARFVMDVAVSPMEAHLALFLCLPPKYGGYGLKRPSLMCASMQSWCGVV